MWIVHSNEKLDHVPVRKGELRREQRRETQYNRGALALPHDSIYTSALLPVKTLSLAPLHLPIAREATKVDTLQIKYFTLLHR
jgi:hypothetical protein